MEEKFVKVSWQVNEKTGRPEKIEVERQCSEEEELEVIPYMARYALKRATKEHEIR